MKLLENLMYAILATVIIMLILVLFTQLGMAEGSTYTVQISSGQLNIRDKPGRDGEVIGYLVNGDLVPVLEAESGWYRVEAGTESGEGWVSAEYLSLEGIPTGDYTNTSGGRARVRKEPGGKTLRWIKDGATVDVKSWAEKDSELWAYLGNGYVLGECLEDEDANR